MTSRTRQEMPGVASGASLCHSFHGHTQGCTFMDSHDGSLDGRGLGGCGTIYLALCGAGCIVAHYWGGNVVPGLHSHRNARQVGA